MTRLDWNELSQRCQKPDHRTVGNWMARRVARPAALRITRVVLPTGLRANAVTCAAWCTGLAGATALAWGSTFGWVLGAALLQAWYLLDHVDGQVARGRREASLDGAQLDYLMHHSLNLLVPLGVGTGLFSAHGGQPLWLLAGIAWGHGTWLLMARHDARCKAFHQRLKRLHGTLHAVGGSGGRPQAPPPAPGGWRRLAWCAQKLCEPHVTINVIGLLALAALASGPVAALLACAYCGTMAVLAPAVAAGILYREQCRGETERQFAAWFRVPPGGSLHLEHGWWQVRFHEQNGPPQATDRARPEAAGRSS